MLLTCMHAWLEVFFYLRASGTFLGGHNEKFMRSLIISGASFLFAHVNHTELQWNLSKKYMSDLNPAETQIYIYISYYIYNYIDIWAPVKKLYIWVVAIVMAIAFGIFWGGSYRFPGFCGNQHVRDPTWSQNPFLNRLGNGSMIEKLFVGFRCFGNTSCSFHVHSSSFHFVFISLHFHFIILSCSFHL